MSGKITPFLWFDRDAEQAAAFYVSLFPNSRITNVARYGEAGPGEPGQAMTVQFELDGVAFTALNGGPEHPHTPAFSLSIDCADQSEVDSYWDRLVEGGRPIACGWLQDRFGVHWQVVPELLPRLLSDGDRTKADAVMRAMMEMVKLDANALQAAYDAA